MAQPSGHRSFMLSARYPGSPNPTNRALGEYGELTLAEARGRARQWLALLRQGIDLKVAAARERAAEQQRQEATVAAVWQAYQDAEAGKLTKADELKRAGAAFKAQWGIRPADEITPAEGHNRFGHLRRMYRWAIGSGAFNITTSPCRDLSPRDLFGGKVSRDRVLPDEESRAI